MRWLLALLMPFALVGCGGSVSSTAASRTSTTTPTAATSTSPTTPTTTPPEAIPTNPAVPTPPPPHSPFADRSLQQPRDRCGTPNNPATTVRFPARGGAKLDGALVGRGPIGVVLLHQFPGPMCGWWQYAEYLAQHGFEALLFDFRCFGSSSCPSHDQADPVADVSAAATVLRRSGARKIAVIGASMGGAVAVLAADRMKPSPAAMVDLSGQMDDLSLLGGAASPSLNPGEAAAELHVPSLFVVAQHDAYASLSEMTGIYRRSQPPIKRMIVEPVTSGHGWDMLNGVATTWSPLASIVTGFITAAARR
jgi:dienelactone hydrolase